MVGGMEGAMGGREGGSDDVIQGGSGSRRREGVMVEGGRFNNGTSEEWPERGMDGAREIKAVGSERRKEGAGGREQPSE